MNLKTLTTPEQLKKANVKCVIVTYLLNGQYSANLKCDVEFKMK